MSIKLVRLIAILVVGLHQGQRTYAPHQQAGHMTAADQIVRTVKKVLATRPSTYDQVLEDSNDSVSVYRQAAFITAPSMTTPAVTYFQSATSSFRASARGLRAPFGRAGGFAIPASYAARAGLEAVNALTFEVDPSVGAGRSQEAVKSSLPRVLSSRSCVLPRVRLARIREGRLSSRRECGGWNSRGWSCRRQGRQ